MRHEGKHFKKSVVSLPDPYSFQCFSLLYQRISPAVVNPGDPMSAPVLIIGRCGRFLDAVRQVVSGLHILGVKPQR
jgi:predicted RNA-binding protein YlqC (UPF0109 family)